MSRRPLTLLLSALLAVGLVAGALLVALPYVSLGPGPTFNTLGDEGGTPVIRIEGRPSYPAPGHLNLTTVGVRSRLTLAEALAGWLRRDEAVLPRELVFPPGESDAQVDAENTRQMTESQDAATTAALTQLGIPVEVHVDDVAKGSPADGKLQAGDLLTGVDGTTVTGPAQLRRLIAARPVGGTVRIGYRRGSRSGEQVLTTTSSGESPPRPVVGVGTRTSYPFTVKIGLKDVGGPSAGLMFALGVVEKLEPGSLTDGRFVAGTGEIAPDGTVRPIGGIQQKVVAARRAGAVLFLVPAANCRDAAANAPAGLQLAKVTSLADALHALQVVHQGGQPPGC